MDRQDLFEKIKETLLSDKLVDKNGCKFAYDGIYMMYFKINGLKRFIRIKQNNTLEILEGVWLGQTTRIAFINLENLSIKDRIKEVKKALKFIKKEVCLCKD